MKNLIIVFFVLAMIACTKKDVKENSIVLRTITYIELKDVSGKNLLDPEVPNHYNHDDVYTFILDASGNEEIIRRDNVKSDENATFFIRFHGAEGDLSENPSTVFLRLSPSDVDTIKTEYKKEPNNFFVTKQWYNGELKWTIDDDKIIEIIKK